MDHNIEYDKDDNFKPISKNSKNKDSSIIIKKNKKRNNIQKLNKNINKNNNKHNNNKYKKLIFIVIILISFIISYFIYNSNNSNNSNNNNNNELNSFNNLINNLNSTNEFKQFIICLKSQNYMNNLKIKKDKNYKRPISIHISTKNKSNLIEFIYKSFNNSNQIIEFSNFSSNQHKNIIEKIKNSNSNSIFIFNITRDSSSIDLGFLEKIIDGDYNNSNNNQIPNLTMNDIYLIISNIGQNKINNEDSNDENEYYDKIETIIKESKLIFKHRLIHRIRDNICL